MSDSNEIQQAPATEIAAEEQTPSETAAQVVQQALESKVEEAPKEEAKPEEQKPEAPKEAAKTEKEKRAAQQFAALSRKEKQLREAEKAYSARVKALEEREKALKEPAKAEEEAPKDPIEIRIKRDPFGTLKELGLDFDHLTKVALNEGKLTPEMQLKLQQEELDRKYATKLEALEKKLQDKEQSEKEAQERATEEKAIRDFKTSIADEIKSDSAAYEMLQIEGEDGIDLIFEVINEHYRVTAAEGQGRIMDVKEAAKLVEDQLLEVAKKYTGLSKIKGLFGAPAQAAPKVASESAKKGATTTLSNSQTASVPAKKVTQLSREEELNEAAKLIRFQQ